MLLVPPRAFESVQRHPESATGVGREKSLSWAPLLSRGRHSTRAHQCKSLRTFVSPDVEEIVCGEKEEATGRGGVETGKV